ncbi:MAG TPA: FtsK/SpoIIIE domain-containing protein, partial [Micromonosporaceae bacterium]|nr:FtsK/SpoIIIE domain-containing protein [Micromonosporaceae bacterium]
MHTTAADARWDLAAARGAARAAQAAAQTAAGHARQDRDECRRTYGARLARLAERREVDLRNASDGFRQRALGLGRALDALAARSAPGAAGSPWRTWRPSEPGMRRSTAAAQAPLLRIGAISVERPLPALVPLLDRAHLWLSGDSAVAAGVVAGLLLRALGSTAPGDVRLTVYDPERLGGALAAFAPLCDAGLLTFVGPDGLGAALDGLVADIGRINALLGGEHASLADLAEATAHAAGGRRPEPWRVAVLLVDDATAAGLTDGERAQLERIARTGAACGVHLIVRGLPPCGAATVHRVAIEGGDAVCTTTADLPVRLDPPPPADKVAAVCRDVADRVLAGPPPAELEDLQPARPWTESSATGLVAPLGTGPDGELVEIALGESAGTAAGTAAGAGPTHALVAGPPGSGRTNLVHAWLAALCARYGPDELAVYLIDCSAGGSFAQFAPSPCDPTWLPQVRLIAVNAGCRSDDAGLRFGAALLRHVGDELRHRAAVAARHGARGLAELRALDPAGRWPRLLVVIDEYASLAAGGEAAQLLADLARRGPTHGVHLLLAG